ncbi:hypothetical protein V7128_19695 [Neobacillus vireti]|uniref:hypothetical protein n=1 Tax=Neobacillus vireti TaxID=220686 RepID=UPI002FFE059B
MRIKGNKNLLEIINKRTDIEECLTRNQEKDPKNSKQLPFLSENELKEWKIIMEKDEEGIITSYPNKELKTNKIAIKRKTKKYTYFKI